VRWQELSEIAMYFPLKNRGNPVTNKERPFANRGRANGFKKRG
jgi:hypothetical protein